MVDQRQVPLCASKECALILGFLAMLFPICFFGPEPPPLLPHCDLNQAKNRLFQNYFGLELEEILFVKTSKLGDFTQCSDHYTGNLAHEDLTDNSTIIFAEQGSGKTLLGNCRRFARLHNGRYIVDLDKEFIDKTLRTFAEIVTRERSPENVNVIYEIEQHWTSGDFNHALVSAFTAKLIDDYEKSKELRQRILQLNEYDTIELIDILCLYFPKDQSILKLKRVVMDMYMNYFYRTRSAVTIALVKLFEWTPTLSTEFSPKRVRDLRVIELAELIRVRHWHDEAAMLLLGIHKQVDSEISPITDVNDAARIIKFFSFLSPVIGVDGLDESRYFFAKGTTTLNAFQVFVNSSLNLDIQNLVVGNHLNVEFSFPLVPGLVIPYIRTQKISKVDLRWSPSHLLNYANFLLQRMRSRQRPSCCQVLPEFHYFVPEEYSLLVFTQVLTPRALNVFMSELFAITNESAGRYGTLPYQADEEQIIRALDKVNQVMRS